MQNWGDPQKKNWGAGMTGEDASLCGENERINFWNASK